MSLYSVRHLPSLTKYGSGNSPAATILLQYTDEEMRGIRLQGLTNFRNKSIF